MTGTGGFADAGDLRAEVEELETTAEELAEQTTEFHRRREAIEEKLGAAPFGTRAIASAASAVSDAKTLEEAREALAELRRAVDGSAAVADVAEGLDARGDVKAFAADAGPDVLAGVADQLQRQQGPGEGDGMEPAEWVAEEREDGGWWLAGPPAAGDRVRLPSGHVGVADEPWRGEVVVTDGGDDPYRRWGTHVRYPYAPPRRRLPAVDAPQKYPVPDPDLAEMREYAPDAVLRRGVWVQLRPGDAEDYPDGICAVCEGEGRLHCRTCDGDTTLTCRSCDGTDRCRDCGPDDDCDHGCGTCRGSDLSCPDCRDGHRACPQRRAKWCHLDG